MAVATPSFVTLTIVSLLISAAHGQLSPSFYSITCPSLQSIVQSGIARAVNRDLRMGASLLRLFFHDCFVNGCDGSVLLDDTATVPGEQNAIPNQNSLRGFDVIDTIKASVEAACRATVSCADILALAARDGVVQLGGPTWTVQLGRRDATTASKEGAEGLPAPFSNLSVLIQQFKDKGLSPTDLTALSGSHTIGQAQCKFFRPRIYKDTNIDTQFAATRRQNCPTSGGDLNLAPLDLQSPNRFGNDYFRHVMASKALLHSDQELFNGGSQDSLVQQYSANSAAFLSDFASAMVRMGAITPLTGTKGEIRLDCGKVN